MNIFSNIFAEFRFSYLFWSIKPTVKIKMPSSHRFLKGAKTFFSNSEQVDMTALRKKLFKCHQKMLLQSETEAGRLVKVHPPRE
jgi:hypothetical protein